MDQDLQLKLQAFVDGELPEAEAREIANLVARDRDASALAAELRNTRQALSSFERLTQLPETREFYWSKIQRQIEGLERAEPAREPVLWLARLRRLLVPLSAVTVFVVVTGISLLRSGAAGDTSGELEMASDQMGALTFRSQSEGMTMVWLYDRDGSRFTEEAPADNVEPE